MKNEKPTVEVSKPAAALIAAVMGASVLGNILEAPGNIEELIEGNSEHVLQQELPDHELTMDDMRDLDVQTDELLFIEPFDEEDDITGLVYVGEDNQVGLEAGFYQIATGDGPVVPDTEVETGQ